MIISLSKTLRQRFLMERSYDGKDAIGRPKYIVEGRALDGRGLTAVVQPFSTRQLVVIVTVYET